MYTPDSNQTLLPDRSDNLRSPDNASHWILYKTCPNNSVPVRSSTFDPCQEVLSTAECRVSLRYSWLWNQISMKDERAMQWSFQEWVLVHIPQWRNFVSCCRFSSSTRSTCSTVNSFRYKSMPWETNYHHLSSWPSIKACYECKRKNSAAYMSSRRPPRPCPCLVCKTTPKEDMQKILQIWFVTLLFPCQLSHHHMTAAKKTVLNLISWVKQCRHLVSCLLCPLPKQDHGFVSIAMAAGPPFTPTNAPFSAHFNPSGWRNGREGSATFWRGFTLKLRELEDVEQQEFYLGYKGYLKTTPSFELGASIINTLHTYPACWSMQPLCHMMPQLQSAHPSLTAVSSCPTTILCIRATT